MIWANIVILSSLILGTFVELFTPEYVGRWCGIIGSWGITFLQWSLGPWCLSWGYMRACTWPQNTPPIWKRHCIKLASFSLTALILGTIIAFYAQNWLVPVIDAQHPFGEDFLPPPPPFWLLASNVTLVGVGLGLGILWPTRSIHLLTQIKTFTHSAFLPFLSIAMSLIIIGTHRESSSIIIHDNIWSAFLILGGIAVCYIGGTLLACKRYTTHSAKDLLYLLFSPLIITKTMLLPPTAATVAPYLPQCRQTSLFLHYNITMELLCTPMVLTTAFLCHTTPSALVLLGATPLMLMFRLMIPTQPLLAHCIGALTLTLWDLPLPYVGVTIWSFALCDIIMNLAQIFTSYASLMFFLPPASRIGRPIYVFTDH